MASRKKTGEENDAPLTFEAAMKRLTAIVEALETGELSLEDSLARFEEGVHLARTSQRQLDAAEARVEELLKLDGQGLPVIEEVFEP